MSVLKHLKLLYAFDLVHFLLLPLVYFLVSLTPTLSLTLHDHLITESGSTVAALQEGIIVATV